ncbi:hypothetical protein L1887_58154 [Cichorium endivia]|nr:hypothetical protein L1887_58154 [Cichorium endivia]
MSGHAVVSRRNEDGAAQQSASGALCARANGNGENTSGPSLGGGVDIKDRKPAAQYQLRVAGQVCQRERSSESGREDEGVCMKMATPKKKTRADGRHELPATRSPAAWLHGDQLQEQRRLGAEPRAGTGGPRSVARVEGRVLAPIGTRRRRIVGCAATAAHATAGHACHSVTSIRHGKV